MKIEEEESGSRITQTYVWEEVWKFQNTFQLESPGKIRMINWF